MGKKSESVCAWERERERETTQREEIGLEIELTSRNSKAGWVRGGKLIE